jgi:hypothetical protein
VSYVGIGGVLPQVQDGQERVLAYYSKTQNKAERNYCITWQELLAIMRTLEHFHKYLYGQEFHLCTDHSALTWHMSFKNLEGQTVCWIQCLQEYNFTSSTIRSGSITMPMLFPEDHAKKNVCTIKNSRCVQTSSMCELLWS